MAYEYRERRRLTEHEEFEIMKLVLDKFLWLGTALMGFGLYTSIEKPFFDGLYYIAAGAVLIALFGWITVREFEFISVR